MQGEKRAGEGAPGSCRPCSEGRRGVSGQGLPSLLHTWGNVSLRPRMRAEGGRGAPRPPPCGPPPPRAAAPAAPPGRNPQRPPSSADRNRGWKRDRPSPRGGGWARGSPRALPGPLAAPAPGQGPPPPPPRQAGEGAQPHLPASPLRRGHGGAAVPSPPRCVG